MRERFDANAEIKYRREEKTIHFESIFKIQRKSSKKSHKERIKVCFHQTIFQLFAYSSMLRNIRYKIPLNKQSLPSVRIIRKTVKFVTRNRNFHCE